MGRIMGKRFVQVYIPTIASLYFVISIIVGLPYTVEFLGILALVALFLGLWISTVSNQYDGQMVIKTTEEGKKIFSLELESNPEDLEDKDEISFKVVSNAE